MTQYANFYDAWLAKNAPKPTPAQKTWTPGNLQSLADAYAYGYTNPSTGAVSGGNPTWTPPADQNAALPKPIRPVVFDPLNDPAYAAGYSGAQNANTHAGAEHDYQTHNLGQSYGYDQNGQLISSGADLNPYAQAAVLKRNYDNSVRGTTNSYAANGQLYSGALINAQNANNFQYGQNSDQLQRTANNAYHTNDLNLQGTQDQGVNQLAALLGPAFANFLAQQGGK